MVNDKSNLRFSYDEGWDLWRHKRTRATTQRSSKGMSDERSGSAGDGAFVGLSCVECSMADSELGGLPPQIELYAAALYQDTLPLPCELLEDTFQLPSELFNADLTASFDTRNGSIHPPIISHSSKLLY